MNISNEKLIEHMISGEPYIIYIDNQRDIINKKEFETLISYGFLKLISTDLVRKTQIFWVEHNIAFVDKSQEIRFDGQKGFQLILTIDENDCISSVSCAV